MRNAEGMGKKTLVQKARVSMILLFYLFPSVIIKPQINFTLKIIRCTRQKRKPLFSCQRAEVALIFPKEQQKLSF
jgi:hypothetical protein